MMRLRGGIPIPFVGKFIKRTRRSRLGNARAQKSSSDAKNSDTEGYVPVEGGFIYYKIQGKGPPIVIVHGGPGLDQTYLQPQMSRLAENHTLIFYDQRASGRSKSVLDKKHLCLEKFIEDLEEVRKYLKLDPFMLLGHSWGGLLAMHYLAEYPEFVKALILVGTSPLSAAKQASMDLAYEMRLSDHMNVLRNRFTDEQFYQMDPDEIQDTFRILFAGYCCDPKSVYDLTLNFTIPAAYSGHLVSRFVNWAREGVDVLSKINSSAANTPSLILHGDHDLIPTSAAREAQSVLRSSTLCILSDCGHFPYIEAPEPFFEEIRLFLQAAGQGLKDYDASMVQHSVLEGDMASNGIDDNLEPDQFWEATNDDKPRDSRGDDLDDDDNVNDDTIRGGGRGEEKARAAAAEAEDLEDFDDHDEIAHHAFGNS